MWWQLFGPVVLMAPAHTPQLQGEGEHLEGEEVPDGTMARLPRAVGMAPASFPVHFPFLALWRGLSTVPQVKPQVKSPSQNHCLSASKALSFVCSNLLIIAKRKMAGSRGVGDSNKGLPDEGLSCCNQRSGFNKWLLFTNHFKALQLLSKRCFYT